MDATYRVVDGHVDIVVNGRSIFGFISYKAKEVRPLPETFFDRYSGGHWINIQSYIPWYEPTVAAAAKISLRNELITEKHKIPQHIIDFINEHG